MADDKLSSYGGSYLKYLLVSPDKIGVRLGTGLKLGIKEAGEYASKELDKFGKDLKGIFDDVLSSFSVSLKGAMNELNDMLSFSKLSNKETRNLAFRYGFNASESYGWTNAMNMLGFESEEDLFYANTQELQQFREAFEKYSNYYTKLYDEGFFKQMQEYQFEMEDFKKEMQLTLVEFIIDNKDLIISGMKGILTLTDLVLSGFQGVLNFLGRDYRPGATSDVVNNYANSNRSTSLTVNNTFNGSAQNNAALIANLDTLTYEQTIRALGGR